MEAACLVRSLGLPQGEEALKARLRRPGHPRLREALAEMGVEVKAFSS